MTDQPRLICVTGPDGAGKTTQIKKLATILAKRKGERVAAVTIWDLLLDPDMKSLVPFKTLTQVDDYLGALDPITRTHFLYHCLHAAMELGRAKGPTVVLINSYWYKYYATEVAHGGPPDLLRLLARAFPEPDLTFYLKVDIAEAFNRKVQLSGYETGFAEERSLEAFESFQDRAHRALHLLAEEKDWIEIDGTEPIDVLTRAIVSDIDSLPSKPRTSGDGTG